MSERERLEDRPYPASEQPLLGILGRLVGWREETFAMMCRR
jgi:hypothetical protein